MGGGTEGGGGEWRVRGEGETGWQREKSVIRLFCIMKSTKVQNPRR